MPQAQADCLFCKIVRSEVPATVVRDGDRTLAFRDINPQAPTHVLVIPKAHHESAAALATADDALLAEVIREAHEVAVGDGLTVIGDRQLGHTKSVMLYGSFDAAQRQRARAAGLEIEPVALQDLFVHLTTTKGEHS